MEEKLLFTLKSYSDHSYDITYMTTILLELPASNKLNDIYIKFYHGYCKDQRNAAVIILRYTTLRHNG